MEQGTIARWLKHEGDEVHKGDVLADVETDKATMQLESYASGRLQRILLAEGQSAPIGTPIAMIGAAGEVGAAPPAPTAPRAAPPSPPPAPVAAPPPAAPAPSAPGGVRASPLARRLAEELGIDLRTVEGTGPGGRITREDIEAAAQKQRPVPAPPPVAPAAPAPAVGVERKATRMQETIARRMVQSKTTAPHYYVTVPIDLTDANQLRGQLNATWTDVRVGITEMLVKAVGMALQAAPLVNASWQDGQIVTHEAVNVGLIVATPEGGLLVPVLHGVDQLDLRSVARETKALVARTREGKARPGDYEGGTFSISNLGHYPVEVFQAIINPPESAILAVGQVAKTPVVHEDQVVIREIMHASLSADHRVFYGVTAAEFLTKVKDLLEHPLSLLT